MAVLQKLTKQRVGNSTIITKTNYRTSAEMEVAVFTDCCALINTFVRHNDAHFSTFCACWKKMRFQHIYSAQSTTVELFQTTAAAFYIAKRFAIGEHRPDRGEKEEKLLQRIGGLYLIYAIYFKQPTEQYMKVQMTMDDWKRLRVFISTLQVEKPANAEVQYIFWKLWQSHAFRFTALIDHVGLEQLVDFERVEEEEESNKTLNKNKRNEAHEKLKEELHTFGKTQELLPALTVLEDGYNEMKEMLAKQTGISKRALPNTTIFKDIASSFQRIQNIIEEKPLNSCKTNQQSTKRTLKEKGYKIAPHSSEENETETDQACSSSRSLRRMSARTVFAEQLTSTMRNELEMQSEEEQEEEIEKEKYVQMTDMSNQSLDELLRETIEELQNSDSE